jgi:hypothetical protein
MDVLRVLDPIALQGSEVVAIAEFYEQLLENSPVAIAADGPEFAFEVTPLRSAWMRSLSSSVLSTSTRKTVVLEVIKRPTFRQSLRSEYQLDV